MNDLLPADLHLVDERRVRVFEDGDDAPQCRTVIRMVDMTRLFAEDVAKLDELIIAFGRQEADFMQLLHQRPYRRYCRGNDYRKLRNQWVKQHAAAKKAAKAAGQPVPPLFPYGLQARQWKMALQAAANTMERYWRQIQTEVRRVLLQRQVWSQLNPAEQWFINSLLSELSDRFFDLLDGKTPAPKDAMLKKGEIKRPGQLCDLLRQIVHEVQGSLPVHGASRSAWLDCDCWSPLKPDAEGNQRMNIMSLLPGKRVDLTLKGHGTLRGTLMLVKKDGAFFIHVLQKIKAVKADEASAAAKPEGKLTARACDMGFSEVFTDDEGRRYGTELGEAITAYAKVQDAKLRERNQLQALAKNTTDGVKRRHLLKFNLGLKKWEDDRRRHRAQIENCVNRALNRMMEDGRTDVFIVEAFGRLFQMEGISKKVRNRLSRWVRGLIDERLAFKAAVHQVRVAKVPAAYSSQCCPACGFTDRENRHGDRFKCLHCGAEHQADQVGALNLLARIHDPFFGRYTSKDAIRRHLRESYEEGCRQRGEVPRPPSPPKKKTPVQGEARS